MNRSDLQGRLNRLQATLTPVQALLLEDPVTLRYLTGFDLSAGKLFLTTHFTYLLVDNRYFSRCRQQSVCPVELLSAETLTQLLLKNPNQPIHRLLFDSTTTTYQRFVELQQQVHDQIPHLILQPQEAPLQQFRMIKDQVELACMEAAGNLCVEGMRYVLSLIREGITERELALKLEIFWLERGGEGLSFNPIIAFGMNSAFPHYRSQECVLQTGDTILIDIGVRLKGYHSDMTRTFFFGTPNPTMKHIYQLVDEAQDRAIAKCRPGVTSAELDLVARNFLNNQGYGDRFLHGLGHGVGLEIHEYPSVNSRACNLPSPILEEHMVIAVEPGIYLEGLGGVRLEDTLVLTQEGCRSLTPFPKDPIF